MGLAPYPWLERPAEVLSKMLGKLPGGVLIYGPRGCGVFELASRFAAAVVCQHPVDGAPCGICEECKLIFSGNHPDLRYVLSEDEERRRWRVFKPGKVNSARFQKARVFRSKS